MVHFPYHPPVTQTEAKYYHRIDDNNNQYDCNFVFVHSRPVKNRCKYQSNNLQRLDTQYEILDIQYENDIFRLILNLLIFFVKKILVAVK